MKIRLVIGRGVRWMTQRVWDKGEDKEDLLLLYGTEIVCSGTAVLADDGGLINSVCVSALYGRLYSVFRMVKNRLQT